MTPSIRFTMPMLAAALIACLLGAVGPAQAQTRGARLVVAGQDAGGKVEEVALYRSVRALIVGIDSYRDLPRSRQLKYAVRDAKGVARVLDERFEVDEIRTLYDREATKEGLLNALYSLGDTHEDDAVFVFWAGHGTTVQAARGGEPQGFLVPHDGTLDEARLWRNVSMDELRQVIKARVRARHVFLVVDACYGGLISETRAVGPGMRHDIDYLRRITQETAVQALSAGTADQEVLDGGPDGHSVFTGHFIRQLERVDDFITAREIGSFVERAVHHDARERNHDQVPLFGRVLGGAGDFVFIAKDRPSAQAAAPTGASADAVDADQPRLLHTPPDYVLLGDRVTIQVATPGLPRDCVPQLLSQDQDGWSRANMAAIGAQRFEAAITPPVGLSEVRYYVEARCSSGDFGSATQGAPHVVPVL